MRSRWSNTVARFPGEVERAAMGESPRWHKNDIFVTKHRGGRARPLEKRPGTVDVHCARTGTQDSRQYVTYG